MNTVKVDDRGPRVCVGALVLDSAGRVALVRTKRGWELAGGKVKLGETWRAALLREMFEELLYEDVRDFTSGGQLEEDQEALIETHRERVSALRAAFRAFVLQKSEKESTPS